MKRTSLQLKKTRGRRNATSGLPPSASEVSGGSGSRANRKFWVIAGTGVALIVLLAGGLLAYRWSVGSQIIELRRSSEQALRVADWPTLERCAREWAVLEPNSVRPWTLAASAARAMGDLQQCANYLAQLPDTAPVEAFHELSLLQMETLIQPLAARQTCERTLRIYPSDNESSLRLLFTHAMLCQRAAVTNEARRAIGAGADSRATYAYLFTANWLTFSNGDEINQFWLQQDPENENFQVAALAHAILHRDINSAALANDSSTEISSTAAVDERAQLLDLQTRYPNNVELQMIALSNFLQAGQVAEMGEQLAAMSPIAQQAPTAQQDCRYWRFTGWYLAAQEQWAEAIVAYQRALTICPFDFSSQNELAGVWRRSQAATPATAADLQMKAKLGIDCSLAFLRAPNFEAVSDSDYAQLANYFELCGETESANGLRKHLR